MSESESTDESLCDNDLTAFIKKRDWRRPAPGGYSDVWKCAIGTLLVAVKVIRPGAYDGDRDKALQKTREEIDRWSILEHPNILPVMGVCYCDWSESPLPAIVSPWMKNGTSSEYIRSRDNVDIASFIYQTVEGLSFLHNRGVVHGDFRGANVLVSDDGCPQIIDFGLSRIINEGLDLKTSASRIGAVRWMPIEFFDFTPDNRPTKESDVWSLGMTILEYWSGRDPFDKIGDCDVVLHLYKQRLPEWPASSRYEKHGVWLQSLHRECCALNPANRPSLSDLKSRMMNMSGLQNDVYNEGNIVEHQPSASIHDPETPTTSVFRLPSTASSERNSDPLHMSSAITSLSHLTVNCDNTQVEEDNQSSSSVEETRQSVVVFHTPPIPGMSPLATPVRLLDRSQSSKSNLTNYLTRTGRLNSMTYPSQLDGGTANQPRWTAWCRFHDREVGKGTSGIKKEAREEAARQALITLSRMDVIGYSKHYAEVLRTYLSANANLQAKWFTDRHTYGVQNLVRFTSVCTIDGREFGRGIASRKAEAEEEAAKQTVLNLRAELLLATP